MESGQDTEPSGGARIGNPQSSDLDASCKTLKVTCIFSEGSAILEGGGHGDERRKGELLVKGGRVNSIINDERGEVEVRFSKNGKRFF
jgi:hypothetical protein